MKAVQQFNSLHNKKVTRQKIERVIALAKKENQTAIIYRLSQLLALKKEESFKVKILKHPIANFLTGTMHTGSYKTALDNCGRLRPGYKFENGTVVKVGAKKVATPKPIVIQKKVVVKHNPSVSKSTLKKSKKAVAIVI